MFWTTKYAITFNYRRPRQVDIGMLAMLRGMFCYGVVFQHIVLMTFGVIAAVPQGKVGTALIGPIISLCIWAVFCILEQNIYPIPSYKKWIGEDEEAVHEETDTQGIRYADVAKVKGYKTARYTCPVPISNVQAWDSASDDHCLAVTAESSVFVESFEKVGGGADAMATKVIKDAFKHGLKDAGGATSDAVQEAGKAMGSAVTSAVQGLGSAFGLRGEKSQEKSSEMAAADVQE